MCVTFHLVSDFRTSQTGRPSVALIAGMTSCHKRAHLRANMSQSKHCEKCYEWVCWLYREHIGHLNGHSFWVL
jgi:hypothetical protein